VQCIKHDHDFFLLEGTYQFEDRTDNVVCSLKKGSKKTLKKNGKAYEKFSEHIGYLPLVIISPADSDLIGEGSEIRRRFIDGIISQNNKAYLQHLINYNKVLKQRNALLKYFAINKTFDALNLRIYDEQLVTFGTKIFNARAEFLSNFTTIFQQRYLSISRNQEEVNIIYKSQMHEQDFLELLSKNVARDRLMQFTTTGIHKDDLLFEINGHPVKKFGSQGQQKSFLIALKFAQFDFIASKSNTKPILLLDDIFDKLDQKRVAQIIALVNNDHFGQIFISDTHKERTESVIKSTQKDYKIFELQ
jgi:DNA replication and repair protein RecF